MKAVKIVMGVVHKHYFCISRNNKPTVVCGADMSILENTIAEFFFQLTYEFLLKQERLIVSWVMCNSFEENNIPRATAYSKYEKNQFFNKTPKRFKISFP